MARIVNIVGRALRGADRIAFPFFRNGEAGVFLDPSDISTLFQDTAGTVPVTAPGQTVARANDISGNGNHATQATAAARPTYQVDAATGLGYLSFDGVDDFLVTPTITPNTDKVQVFAGVRNIGPTSDIQFVANMALTGAGSLWLEANSTLTRIRYHNGGALRAASESSLPSPRTQVITGIFDHSAPLISLRTDGITRQDTTAGDGVGSFSNSVLAVGAQSSVSARFLNGHIHQLITRFGPNLPTADIEKAERYVASRTAGVTIP